MGNFCIPTPTFLQQYARMLHVADGCYDSYSLYMVVLMFGEYREAVLPRASMHNPQILVLKKQVFLGILSLSACLKQPHYMSEL